MSPSVGPDRKAREVLEHIQAYPGLTEPEIHEAVGGSKSEIKSAIFRLGTAGIVENRADPDQEPRWHVIWAPVPRLYLRMAESILSGMESTPEDERKEYLAKRLQEYMSS